MPDSPRVLLWPRVVTRWQFGADWCLPNRVRGALDALAPFAHPDVLRGGRNDPGVVLVFDTPTRAFLDYVAPRLVSGRVPFAVSVGTAHVRTRSPQRTRADESAITWRDLRELTALGMAIAVHGHDTDDLARLPDELAFGQLATARDEMRRRLGVDPWLFCDPRSPSRSEIARMAGDLGFRAGIVRGVGSPWGEDVLRRPAVVPRPWQGTGWIRRQWDRDAARGVYRAASVGS